MYVWTMALFPVLSRSGTFPCVCTGGVLRLGAGGPRNLARDLLFLASVGLSAEEGCPSCFSSFRPFLLPAWLQGGPAGKGEGKSVPKPRPRQKLWGQPLGSRSQPPSAEGGRRWAGPRGSSPSGRSPGPHAGPLYLERARGKCVDLTQSRFGGQVAPPNPGQPLDEVFPFARVAGVGEHMNFIVWMWWPLAW